MSRAQAPVPDRDLGRHLSSECVACHQASGRQDGIASIVGWPDRTFIAAMNDYRAKNRPNVIMQSIAGKLNDHEIAALAAYFGRLSPRPAN